jgi:hypothetical protein
MKARRTFLPLGCPHLEAFFMSQRSVKVLAFSGFSAFSRLNFDPVVLPINT